MQCTNTPRYPMSPGLLESILGFFFLSLLSGSDVMFERECFSHWSFILVS